MLPTKLHCQRKTSYFWQVLGVHICWRIYYFKLLQIAQVLLAKLCFSKNTICDYIILLNKEMKSQCRKYSVQHIKPMWAHIILVVPFSAIKSSLVRLSSMSMLAHLISTCHKIPSVCWFRGMFYTSIWIGETCFILNLACKDRSLKLLFSIEEWSQAINCPRKQT